MYVNAFRQWLRRTFGPAYQPKQRSNVKSIRPEFEDLEKREVPATFKVTGFGDGVETITPTANPTIFNATTLRAAINAAAANGDAANTILLVNGTYNVKDELVIDSAGGKTLDILNNSTGMSVINNVDANNDSRVLRIDTDETVNLFKLQIQNGNAVPGTPFGTVGGGILNFGTLDMKRCVVTLNKVVSGAEGFAQGGGIANFGFLSLTSPVISQNIAQGGDDLGDSYGGDTFGGSAEGGGIFNGYNAKLIVLGTLTAINNNKALGGNAFVTDNTGGQDAIGGSAEGGGLFIAGGEGFNQNNIVNLTAALFQGNQAIGGDATATAGTYGGGAFGGEGWGGGIFAEGENAFDPLQFLQINGSTFTSNLAQGGKGNTQGFSASDPYGGFGVGGEGAGGAIFAGSDVATEPGNIALSISASKFNANLAVGGSSTATATDPNGDASGGSAEGGAVFFAGEGNTFGLVEGGPISQPVLAIYGTQFINNDAIGGAATAEGAFGGFAEGGALLAWAEGGNVSDEDPPFDLITLQNNTFTTNTAQGGLATGKLQGFADGGYAEGGGLSLIAEGFDDTFSNHYDLTANTMTGNAARGGNATVNGAGGAEGGGAQGGAIITHVNGFGAEGADFLVKSMHIHASTLNGNTARGGNATTGVGGFAFGGFAAGGGLATGTEGLLIENTTIDNNTALGGNGTTGGGAGSFGRGGSAFGGGISLAAEGTAYGGIAINFVGSDDEPAVIIGSTISNNDATGGNGVGRDSYGGIAEGGGIFFYEDFTGIETELLITNTTLSTNTARGGNGKIAGGAEGGGFIDSFTEGGFTETTFVNSTIAFNGAKRGTGAIDPDYSLTAGGGVVGAEGNIAFLNTIVAKNNSTGNTADDLFNFGGLNFISFGNNLIGNGDANGDGINNDGFVNNASNDQVGTAFIPLDPLLKALANYGGPTKTHALKPGSSALDRGSNIVLPDALDGNLDGDPFSLDFDQRFTGFPRKAGFSVDIGAFEFRPGQD